MIKVVKEDQDVNRTSNKWKADGKTWDWNRKSEGNTITNTLPVSIDDFLHDFAQVYGEISYNDIAKFGNSDNKDLKSLRKYISIINRACRESQLDIYECSEENSIVKDACNNIVKLIKDKDIVTEADVIFSRYQMSDTAEIQDLTKRSI